MIILSGAGSASAPAPIDLANLELWLKVASLSQADDTDINTWNDSSGNGRNATGVVGSGLTKKPRYRTGLGPSGGAAIQMAEGTNTTGPWFTLPNFLTGFTAGNAFVVVKLNADPPSSSALRCGPPLGDWGSTTDEYFPFFSDSKIYDGFGSTARKTTVDPAASLTSWRTYEVRSASGAWSNHLDGTQLFTTATNTVGWGTAPFIGHATTNNKVLDGHIVEVIFFSRVLDDTTERKAVIHTHLNSEYGFSLPV